MMKVKPIYKSSFDFFEEEYNDTGDLTNEAVLQAFRKSISFFNSPPSKKGQDIIDKMKENGWKYLSDGVYDKTFISQVVSNWYKEKSGHSI